MGKSKGFRWDRFLQTHSGIDVCGEVFSTGKLMRRSFTAPDLRRATSDIVECVHTMRW